MSENKQIKKAWYQKPENILVYGGLAFGGWMALKALDTILPLLIRVAENGLYASFLIGSLAILGFLAVNGDFHRLVWLGYTSLMRKLTSLVVELDPIGQMKIYVRTLNGRKVEIEQGLASLRGQAQKLEQLISDKERDANHNMAMAAQAKARGTEAGMRSQLKLHARKAGRAQESSITFQGLLNRVRRHVSVMEKVKEASEFIVSDIEDTIQVESEKRDAIHASYKAMSAARRILAADRDREIYDMALEANVKDYYSKLGEITQFLEDSQGFIQTMDLENGVFEEEALAKLEVWEQRSAGLLEGGTGKTTFRVAPAALTSGTEEFVVEAAPQEHQFAELFGKLDK